VRFPLLINTFHSLARGKGFTCNYNYYDHAVSLRYNESDAREARRDTTGLMSYKPESLARNVVPMLNVN